MFSADLLLTLAVWAAFGAIAFTMRRHRWLAGGYWGIAVCALAARMLLDAVPDIDMSGRARTPVKGEVPNPINPPSGCTFHPRCPFAFDRCRKEEPLLQPVGENHFASCHAVTEGRIKSLEAGVRE